MWWLLFLFKNYVTLYEYLLHGIVYKELNTYIFQNVLNSLDSYETQNNYVKTC
jgi:hypothetical protein